MAGRTAYEAFRAHLDATTAVLGCISAGHFAVHRPAVIEVDETYAAVLNRRMPVRLRLASRAAIGFFAGETFRIRRADVPTHEPFIVEPIGYAYQFSTPNDFRELFAFHWTPEAAGAGERRFPHVHLRSSFVADTGPLNRETFGKLHFPTGQLTAADIVRFAITELNVVPLRPDWAAIIEGADGI